MSSKVDIPGIVTKVRKAFNSKKTRSAEWRKQQINQLVKMFKEHEEEWGDALKKDLGHKGKFFRDSIELAQIYDECQTTLEKLDEWMKKEPHSTPILLQPGASFVVHEPLGVVLIISPWNYPVSLLALPFLGAIAAGNAVILKPSEVSPATSAVFAKYVPTYFDKEAIALIEGGVEETTELLKQKFDYIFYTGNGTVGKIILRAAAEYLTPATLELGGKSPCIVDKTANLEVTANRIVWGKFLNVGQTCVAPDYLLVEKSVENALLQQIKATITKFYGENPQKSEDYSRVINQRHTNRLSSLIERAKKEGVEIITGGTVDVNDQYIAPTLIRNVSKTSVLMEDEIFGPILPVLTWDSIEEAADYVNSRDKPLAAYLYSNNSKAQEYFLHNVTSGGGCINDNVVHVGNPEIPFGGVGPSGMGSYHGVQSFNLFSHHKSIVQKGYSMDVDIRYPPYTNTKLSRMSLLRKIKISKEAVVSVGAVAVLAMAYFIVKVPLVKSLIVTGLRSTLRFVESYL